MTGTEITPPQEKKGEGLLSGKSKKKGEVVCNKIEESKKRVTIGGSIDCCNTGR